MAKSAKDVMRKVKGLSHYGTFSIPKAQDQLLAEIDGQDQHLDEINPAESTGPGSNNESESIQVEADANEYDCDEEDSATDEWDEKHNNDEELHFCASCSAFCPSGNRILISSLPISEDDPAKFFPSPLDAEGDSDPLVQVPWPSSWVKGRRYICSNQCGAMFWRAIGRGSASDQRTESMAMQEQLQNLSGDEFRYLVDDPALALLSADHAWMFRGWTFPCPILGRFDANIIVSVGTRPKAVVKVGCLDHGHGLLVFSFIDLVSNAGNILVAIPQNYWDGTEADLDLILNNIRFYLLEQWSPKDCGQLRWPPGTEQAVIDAFEQRRAQLPHHRESYRDKFQTVRIRKNLDLSTMGKDDHREVHNAVMKSLPEVRTFCDSAIIHPMALRPFKDDSRKADHCHFFGTLRESVDDTGNFGIQGPDFIMEAAYSAAVERNEDPIAASVIALDEVLDNVRDYFLKPHLFRQLFLGSLVDNWSSRYSPMLNFMYRTPFPKFITKPSFASKKIYPSVLPYGPDYINDLKAQGMVEVEGEVELDARSMRQLGPLKMTDKLKANLQAVYNSGCRVDIQTWLGYFFTPDRHISKDEQDRQVVAYNSMPWLQCGAIGCTRRFKLDSEGKAHLRSHVKIECSQCGKRLSSAAKLRYHEQSQHDMHFPCPEPGCTEILTKLAYLLYHQGKAHSDPKAPKIFICDLCLPDDISQLRYDPKKDVGLKKWEFSQLRYLQHHHYAIHDPGPNRPKTFVCDHPDCDQAYWYRDSLVDHKNLVHDPNFKRLRFPCGVKGCKTDWARKEGVSLIRHHINHHPNDPWPYGHMMIAKKAREVMGKITCEAVLGDSRLSEQYLELTSDDRRRPHK